MWARLSRTIRRTSFFDFSGNAACTFCVATFPTGNRLISGAQKRPIPMYQVRGIKAITVP